VADADRALAVARIEVAVADAYRAALDRGTLAPEATDVVLVLAQHHEEHAIALAALARTPRSAVERDGGFYAQLNQTVLSDDPLAAIFDTERSLAATHLASLGVLESTDAAAAVASILPVEAQHVVAVGMSRGLPASSTELVVAVESVDRAFAIT
jgi:hypothetical protein